ncbi:acetyltransferase, GNAT family [Campylobacter rectus RM3267]|uniref:Acetyltransferase, GNAT family n=1 Tax=Campylobacter rectus RM3267 TaxID=553218 RepID=B9CYU4_CAMRE|nr:acetyltransferase, GNAT family [Campylobacter rectus RM3267]
MWLFNKCNFYVFFDKIIENMEFPVSHIQEKYIRDISIADPFFDSLRSDYVGFDIWLSKKAEKGEKAHILTDSDNKLLAFLYLKIENPVDNADINPQLDTNYAWLKIGTLKISPHGTKLGERFIKRIFDFAISNSIFNIYVTVFEKQDLLIKLLKKYGFVYFGKKGDELVLVKTISTSSRMLQGDILLDYPSIATGGDKYILSIYPKYHTGMFSDSMLKTESYDILKDLSESNSIHKVYITKMSNIEQLKRGDCLIIYRTQDKNAPNANYSSVATSLCIVEEYRHISSFENEEEFVKYCKPHNIFTDLELKSYFKTRCFPKIIKMTYNVSFKKRVVLDKIRKIMGYEPKYWGFVKITDDMFLNIIQEGLVNDRIIIN